MSDLVLLILSFMKHTTRWSPDTCECVLEYEWDDAVPENERTHTPTTMIRACSAHASISDVTGKYNQILSENQTKNQALHEIIQNFPEVRKEVIDKNGTRFELKDEIIAGWSFDEDRKLKLNFEGVVLSAAKKVEMIAHLQNKFPNKVQNTAIEAI